MCLHIHVLGRAYIQVCVCKSYMHTCPESLQPKEGPAQGTALQTPCLLEVLPAEQGQPSLEGTAQSMQPHHPGRRNEGETQTQDVDGRLGQSCL